MRKIDIATWSRKDIYEYYQQVDYPHFNINGNLEITDLLNLIKEKELPLFSTITYLVSKATNEMPSFRYRIRDDKVILHDLIHPTFTVLLEDESYRFCEVPYQKDYHAFITDAAHRMDLVKQEGGLADEPGRDDYIFITSIPWFSFTSITHPVQMSPVDSVPRISWGKYFEQEGKVMMPFSIQVHHGLVDGLKVAELFNKLQDNFNAFKV